MQSDAQLIDRIFAGETEAFAVLVKRYERLVWGAAIRIIRDPHLAEDVAQEGFVAAFESLGSLRISSRFGPWLLAIVRRQAARAVRQRCRSPVLATNARADLEPESNGRAAPENFELLELIERLPVQERVVIGLRHFEGHSMHEIAHITGRPIGTVTKQLSRAHQRLRKFLE